MEKRSVRGNLMKIFSSFPQGLLTLGLAIFIIFFGFNGVQQYVTLLFDEKGMVEVGFQSLILIYSFFILGNPLAVIIIGKYGPKLAMMGASLVYGSYIFSLVFEEIHLIYFASGLLGVAAALFWTGENSYLFRISEERSRGRNVGLIETFLFLSSALGVIGVGFFSSWLSLQMVFLPCAIMPLLGFFLLMRLGNVRPKKEQNQFFSLKKALKSPTTIRIAGIWFIVFFVLGLAIGIIPVQIKTMLGGKYVGILTSFFFIFPALLSYFLGKVSDRTGRKKIILVAYALILTALFLLIFSNLVIPLIIGILLLALSWTTARIGLFPLTGDLSTKDNLESIVAVFWIAQNVGVVLALLLGRFLNKQMDFLYIVITAIVIASISFISVLSLFKRNIKDIQKQISNEIC